MRSSPEAGLAPRPLRIPRPWLVATVGGGVLGAALLSFAPPDVDFVEGDFSPRAAVHDGAAPHSLEADPFAPASSLAASPLPPSPEIIGAPAAAGASAETPAPAEP